jgi:hypothetical protein
MLSNISFLKVAKPILSNLIWIACAIYGFIVFFPTSVLTQIGLDASWVYGINHAAIHNLVFGKDIIFTYGPLGYLIPPLATEETFFANLLFQAAIHILLFTVLIVRTFSLQYSLQKLVLFLSLLFFYCLGGYFEYPLAILFILALSIDQILNPKFVKGWGLILGLFAGITLLIKFNIGFFTTTSLIIYLLSAVYQSASDEYRKAYLTALVNAIAALGSTAYIFLHPHLWVGLTKIVLCLVFSMSVSLVLQSRNNSIRCLFSKTHSFFEHSAAKLNKITGNHPSVLKFINTCKGANECRFQITYCLGLLLFIIFVPPCLLEYLRGCLAISSGYSSAMSMVGNHDQLKIGLVGLFLILFLLISRVISGDVGFALASSVLLFISFKHAFVRQLPAFSSLMPILVAIQIPRIRKAYLRKVAYFVYLYTLVLALTFAYVEFVPNLVAKLPPLSDKLSINTAIGKLSILSDLPSHKAMLRQQSDTALAERRLPTDMRKVIGNKLIDVIPWELVLVPVNNLNWQPRPIPQSYSAYTAFLDDMNFKSLYQVPRDYFLYSFMTIDGRHPFFDEPRTFFYVYCNYKVSPRFPEPVILGSQQNALNVSLLERQPESHCRTETRALSTTLAWRTEQALPEDAAIVRAAIKLRFSLLGKLYKTLFRAPPIRMRVTYEDGTVQIYRVVPENAENGILISHLSRNSDEAVALLSGDLPQRVKSFSLQTNNPLVYERTIGIKLSSYDLDASVKQQPLVRLSQMNEVQFIARATKQLLGSFDVAVVPSIGEFKDTVFVSGWAVDRSNASTTWILITTGMANQPLGILKTGERRLDVAKFLNEEKYLNSGWQGFIDSKKLGRGSHDLKMWIYEPSIQTVTYIGQKQIKIP